MSLIEIKDVVGGYGGAPILNGVNIAIEQSDIGVIVGPNGAGKSTTLKAIFGLLKVTGGTITFDGEEITNSLPDKLVPKGPELRAAGKERLHLDERRGKPRDGRLHPPRRFLATRMDWVYDMFPVLRGKAPPAGGRTVGRPAPDGGHGPRADEQAASC